MGKISDTLTKRINVDTGSEFLVIGEEEYLQGSIRVFVEKVTNTNVKIGFRFRVEPKIQVQVPHVGAVLKSKYPEVVWATINSKYGSVSGFVTVPHHITNVVAILAGLKDNKVFEALFDMLIVNFRSMSFLIEEEQFCTMMEQDLAEMLTPTFAVPAAGGGSVIVDFQGEKTGLHAGGLTEHLGASKPKKALGSPAVGVDHANATDSTTVYIPDYPPAVASSEKMFPPLEDSGDTTPPTPSASLSLLTGLKKLKK
jgi:hypothetical protein